MRDLIVNLAAFVAWVLLMGAVVAALVHAGFLTVADEWVVGTTAGSGED